jgi:hypothetical protein
MQNVSRIQQPAFINHEKTMLHRDAWEERSLRYRSKPNAETLGLKEGGYLRDKS